MKLDETFGIHEQSLKLHARRAEVLAGNIANADTPGYKSRDFDFREVLNQQMPQPTRMKTTHSGHINMDQGLVPENHLMYRVPNQSSLDGNTVDSQLEHTAFAQNALEYQASLRFVSGAIKKLRLAIKGQ
ncbi:MAG: flagellar basal body rod protein FlgB [Candidatus Sedimenticola sp. (ex Thyasira tokunagai)]